MSAQSLTKLAAAAREAMEPSWDGARQARVLEATRGARRARAQRRQHVGAALSAVAAAAVFVLAVRGFGGGDASASSGGASFQALEGPPSSGDDRAARTYADGAAYTRDGDGGGLEASSRQ